LLVFAPVSETPRPGRFSSFYPSAYRNRYWRELQRRWALANPRTIPFRQHQIFRTECVYGDIQGRGIPQASRVGPPTKEPRPIGALSGAEPNPEPAVRALLDAFETHRAVAIGEAPALLQEQHLLQQLVASPRFSNSVDDVVVWFGNARYQALVDRYTSGARIRPHRLSHVWRNTSQLLAWDSNVYRQFFATVRDANRGLPGAQQIHVTLGEPPLDWHSADLGDVRRVINREPGYMARLAASKLRQGRHVLVIAGRPLVARREGTITSRLEHLSGYSVFTVTPHLGFATTNHALEQRLSSWQAPSLARLAGTWLGELQSGGNTVGRHASQPLASVADAYLYLGPRSRLTTVAPYPSTYRDHYWHQVKGRYQLLFHQRLRNRLVFPTSNCLQLPGMVGGEASGP
jgi:hypothetical protein